MEIDKLYCCCFFGHRKITETEDLKKRLSRIIEELIEEKNVSTFLFGSKSRFNDLCYEIVSDLKERYPHIKRIYVRAEYPHINEEYEKYLLLMYEETYYPEKITNAGRAIYVERNFEMIDKCDCCIVYYDKKYTLSKGQSGTELAYNYAVKKGLRIVNCN